MKLVLALLFVPLVASADEHHAAPAASHRAPRAASAPRGKEAGARSVGVHITAHPDKPMHAKNNPAHEVIIHDAKTNKDEHHAVIVDHRPAHVIDRDPRLRVVVRGYHPAHNWERFHVARGGWFRAWGIKAWDEVGTVTCEAVNESNGELYPVSEDRDARGWDDDTVNVMLDQALDDCNSEAGGAMCGPVTPACSFQAY
jgi:hypothetical protein